MKYLSIITKMKSSVVRSLIWCASAMALTLTACSYDDGDLWKSVDNLKGRVTALESDVNQLNTNYASLSQLVKALEQRFEITAVEPIKDDNGNTTGYKITMSNGSPSSSTTITLTNGKNGENGKDGENGKNGENGKDGENGKNGENGKDAPVIGVQLDTTDGIYYWTLTSGDTTTWLLDLLGNKMPVSGATPMIGVDANGYWTISYDNGATYSLLLDANGKPIVAKADTTFFKSITSDAEYVYITLNDANGTVITLLKNNAFSFIVKDIEAINYFTFGETRRFTVESTGVTKTVLTKPGEWKVNLTDNVLSITAPTQKHAECADLAGEVAIIYFNDNAQSSVVTLNVAVAPEQEVAENYSIAIPTDFSAGYVQQAVVGDLKIAEICLEFVRTADGSTARQMTVVYPVANGVADLTKGIDVATGGSVVWNTADNTVAYTAGSAAAPLTEIYVNAKGELSATAPADVTVEPATVKAEILRDVRGTEIQEYTLAKIGTQYWMAQSMRAERYTDGSAIAKVADWSNADGAYTVLDNDMLNAPTYGLLYSGRTVFNSKFAPEGWAVPQTADVDKLKAYMGTATVGTKLKAASALWGTKYPGDNLTGFNALPGMFYTPASSTDPFGVSANPDVYFWTATELKDPIATKVTCAAYFRLYYNNTRLTYDPNPSAIALTIHSLDFGHYVRCVRK